MDAFAVAASQGNNISASPRISWPKRIAVLLAALMLMFSSTLAIVPMQQQAAAGWNGQRIQLNGCAARSVTFSGTNERGQWTVVTAYPNSWGVTQAPGFWKGNVRMDIVATFGNLRVKYVWVPTVMATNWVNVWWC